ncbi:unnamed protein product [Microthlaspi erraticum]|uniref:F-box domain-containing protein n=1 Tax=Microthlaspi erraticum TaxID=1685480 RepID=A0A6D2HFV7_9BRAS|nr:unnamed protein product [Microthlaspi erraticum]
MKSLPQKDDQTILTRYSQSSNTANECSEQIPVDLIVEILLRLPAKSVARYRCLSKLWSSIIDQIYFTDSFLTRSSARPQLLFVCVREAKVFFFSSPQAQNPDETSNGSSITANYQMNVPYKGMLCRSHISGLVSIRQFGVLKGSGSSEIEWVICKPSTGQSLSLPRMKSWKGIGR